MREVIIKIRDDLDGVSDAAETLTFVYRGQAYEIDLSVDHVELFDKAMDQFVSAARKVVPSKETALAAPPRGPVKPVDKATKQQRKEIREWANKNGFDVDARGMIAATVIEAYRVANPSVEILPDTPARHTPRYSYSPRKEARVTAQDAQDGLISAASLMDRKYDYSARDRSGEKLGKAKRTEIREWANENGFEQAATGMIKQDVIQAYYDAHPKEGR